MKFFLTFAATFAVIVILLSLKSDRVNSLDGYLASTSWPEAAKFLVSTLERKDSAKYSVLREMTKHRQSSMRMNVFWFMLNNYQEKKDARLLAVIKEMADKEPDPSTRGEMISRMNSAIGKESNKVQSPKR